MTDNNSTPLPGAAAAALRHLDGLQKDFDTRNNALVASINKAHDKGREIEEQQLNKQLDQLKTIYTPALDQAQLAVEQAKQAEQSQAQALQTRLESKELALKAQAQAEWIRAGGTIDAFEQNWPTIRATMLSNMVVNRLSSEPKRPKINL